MVIFSFDLSPLGFDLKYDCMRSYLRSVIFNRSFLPFFLVVMILVSPARVFKTQFFGDGHVLDICYLRNETPRFVIFETN